MKLKDKTVKKYSKAAAKRAVAKVFGKAVEIAKGSKRRGALAGKAGTGKKTATRVVRQHPALGAPYGTHSRKPVKLPLAKKYWMANTNPQVAKEHGVHINTAARFRQNHNLPLASSIKRKVFRQPSVDYSLIDLNLTARENAEKTGLKQSTVAHIMIRLRKQQGLPPGKRVKAEPKTVMVKDVKPRNVFKPKEVPAPERKPTKRGRTTIHPDGWEW